MPFVTVPGFLVSERAPIHKQVTVPGFRVEAIQPEALPVLVRRLGRTQGVDPAEGRVGARAGRYGPVRKGNGPVLHSGPAIRSVSSVIPAMVPGLRSPWPERWRLCQRQ